uniref:SpaO n=1 Tax=Spirochaeta aurantia TaxID=147 RepID=Q0PHZ1_SPIAU|nr:SpaO [Spirochaeta aurantia]
MNIFLILSSVLLNALAQIFLKVGMRAIGDVFAGKQDWGRLLVQAVGNPFLWAGFVSYGLSIALWLAVLSRVEVSKAYPFLSVGYIVTLFLGYFLFSESLTWEKVLGVAVILVGILLISKGGV